eukprot:gene62294-biopygen45360
MSEVDSKPPDDENRGFENAVMLGFFVVLVAAGIWLLGTMADIRKTQDCAAEGRPGFDPQRAANGPPRAGEVPAATGTNDPSKIDAQDRELDRMIKGICKGC